MQTFNSVQLLGHVGQPPEMFQFDDGNWKATLKIATNSGSGDNKKTQWHTLVFYNQAAQLVSALKSGDAILVEGALEYRQWTDPHNQSRHSAEIKVNRFSIVKGELGQVQGNTNQGQQFYENPEPHGYDNSAPSQGGYGNQGGYPNPPQQGGYNNQNQGGRGYNQGGYNNRNNGRKTSA